MKNIKNSFTIIFALQIFINLTISPAPEAWTCPDAGYSYTFDCLTEDLTDQSGYCLWNCDTDASEFFNAGTCYGHGNDGCCYQCY